jgi:hypothetical protein
MRMNLEVVQSPREGGGSGAMRQQEDLSSISEGCAQKPVYHIPLLRRTRAGGPVMAS